MLSNIPDSVKKILMKRLLKKLEIKLIYSMYKKILKDTKTSTVWICERIKEVC